MNVVMPSLDGTRRIRSCFTKTAVCLLFILTNGCGTGCLFIARSSGLNLVAADHPTPEFNQVIKDAIGPFGFDVWTLRRIPVSINAAC